jgi:uncharacterized protein YkwD
VAAGTIAAAVPAAAAPAQTEGPAAEVITLTNARRADAGCGPVNAQAELTRAAQGHAQDMAANGYFDHTGQDGRAPWDRAGDEGYTGNGVGENIAQGYQTPTDVVQGWMESQGHRENIENCGWTSIGVGYDDASKTWVQVFGSGDDDPSAPAPEAPTPDPVETPDAPAPGDEDDGMPGDRPEARPATPVEREPDYTG